MKIRQARFSDLDRIIEIELENFSLEEAIPRSVFEAHLREIQTSFLVAEKEGHILGYIEGPVVPHRHLHDQSFTEKIKDYSHQPRGYISVTCLSIAKEAQALGVGKRLLNGCGIACGLRNHGYIVALAPSLKLLARGGTESIACRQQYRFALRVSDRDYVSMCQRYAE